MKRGVKYSPFFYTIDIELNFSLLTYLISMCIHNSPMHTFY